jgi:hypothetical protein
MEKDTKKLVIPDPDYAVWRVHDQHVLTYLVTSLSWEILAGVASNSTTTDMWVAISKSFASQSRPRVLHLRNQLVATRKDDLSVAAYFSTMHGYADEMAAAGKPLDDNDVVSYILNGLDADYNSLIEHVNGMTDSISPETLYSHMLDTEAWLAAQKTQCEHKEQYQLVAMRLPVVVVATVAISNRAEEDSKGVEVALVVAMEVAAAIPTIPTAIINAKSAAS